MTTTMQENGAAPAGQAARRIMQGAFPGVATVPTSPRPKPEDTYMAACTEVMALVALHDGLGTRVAQAVAALGSDPLGLGERLAGLLSGPLDREHEPVAVEPEAPSRKPYRRHSYGAPVAELVVEALREHGQMNVKALTATMSRRLGFDVPVSTVGTVCGTLVNAGGLLKREVPGKGGDLYRVPEAK